MQEKIKIYSQNPNLVHKILADGAQKAEELANQTMRDVRQAMGLVKN